MHAVRQLVDTGIDGHSTMRQADSAPRSTPVIPVVSVILAIPAIPAIPAIGAHIGRAMRPTSATTTRATLRIPSEPTGLGLSHPVESTSQRPHRWHDLRIRPAEDTCDGTTDGGPDPQIVCSGHRGDTERREFIGLRWCRQGENQATSRGVRSPIVIDGAALTRRTR